MEKRRVHLVSEEGYVLASATMENPTAEEAPALDTSELARQLQERFLKAHEEALKELQDSGKEINRQNLHSVMDKTISDAQIIPSILHILSEKLLEVVHTNLKPLAEAIVDEVMSDPGLGDQMYTVFEAMKTSYLNEALGDET